MVLCFAMENFDLFKLDGHSLRVFCLIAETGSVSRAAEHFNLNQSTISHTLDKLRNALGDPLFVKSGRGITPTEKTLTLLPRVHEILASIEGLVAADAYDPLQDTRPIGIGVPTLASMPELPELYRNFARCAPDMEFRIVRLAPRETTTELLVAGTIDIAIVISSQKFPAILNRCGYRESRMAVFYDADHRGPIRTIEEYAAAKHAVAGAIGRSRSFVETELAKFGLQRRIAVAAPTASMLAEFVKGTDNIATMPVGLPDFQLRGLSSCPMPFTMPKIGYDLVWHRRFDHSGRNKWLRGLILSATNGATA